MSNKYYITNFNLLFRASELEVENEKLRQDYQLLRNSIDRGVESKELEGMFWNMKRPAFAFHSKRDIEE